MWGGDWGMMEGWGKGWGKKGKDKGKDGKGGKGKGAMRIASGEPCYFGQIKTYDAEKTRGYIVCQEVWNMCGSDVYVFEKVLAESQAGPGDTVAFFLHWSATSGQPQASAPMIRIAAADGFALKGTYKSGGEGKDHGFLQCDTTKAFFGRDVYVNKDTASMLEEGMTVAFNAYLNRDKMPNVQAQGETAQAQLCEEGWEPTPADLSVTRTDPNVASKGKDKGKGKGKGKMMAMMMGGWGDDGWGGGKGKGKSKGSGDGTPPKPTGETFLGVVKSFNEKNNYGFIASDDCSAKYGGGDCFVNGTHLNGVAVGTVVEFDVGINKKGQPQATAIRPASDDPAAKRPKLTHGAGGLA